MTAAVTEGKRMIVHLSTIGGKAAICGRWSRNLTGDAAYVTCGACLRSHDYRIVAERARRREAAPVVAAERPCCKTPAQEQADMLFLRAVMALKSAYGSDWPSAVPFSVRYAMRGAA